MDLRTTQGWLTLFFFFVIVCFQGTLTNPTIQLIGHAHSTKGGCADPIADEDFLFYTFDISGNDTTHPFTYEGPRFMYTNNGNPVVACTGFDNPSNACTKRSGIPDACSCEMRSEGTYRLEYKKTARLEDSGEKVYLEWQGSPVIKSNMINIPVITNDSRCAVAPNLRHSSFDAMYKARCTTLIAGQDHFVVQYELFNNNTNYKFTHDGPRFFITNNGRKELACGGFDFPSNACTDRTGKENACSCEMKSQGLYRFTYNKTATLRDSEESIYLEWSGSSPIKYKAFKIPKVTDIQDCDPSSATKPVSAAEIILLAGICVAHALSWR